MNINAPDCRQLAGGSTLYLQRMMGEYLRRYGRLVDGPEEENKGLANFTAAAKALSTGHRRGSFLYGPLHVCA